MLSKRIIPAILLVPVLILSGCWWKNDDVSDVSNRSWPENGSNGISLSGSDQRGIRVSGEGEVTVNPDIVYLTLGIQSQENTVSEAQSQARVAMDKIMRALKADGVEEKDIQTQSYRIEPMLRYEPTTNKSVITGYQVNNMVRVKIRKIDNAGRIIDDVADSGGDLTRIQGISFGVENPKPYYTEARKKAMEDAIIKAEQLAKAAGVKLGKPVYINESGAYMPSPQPVFRAEMAPGGIGGAPPTEISAGELTVRLSLEAHFNIQ
ncbi:MAG: SIMPL domain-containing protein [Dehalococcoidia bacterium]|nr:SIMPL domain-containing protein [Dehalococcoidia bacterium]MDZ4245568.1 SIMPL domain-containing protein [Dehalococcoidia bacterium]